MNCIISTYIGKIIIQFSLYAAYRTNENQPFVFPVVKKCELEIVNDPAMNHEYFPMAGNADYIKVATELILGEGNRALRDNKVSNQ